VLYTAKNPGRCPNCGGTALSRKGSRTKKFETVQRWQCASCGRGFTPAPTELRAKTYPLRVILDGVTLYNLGYTLAEASAKLKTKSGYRVPSSTLAAWIAEHRDLTAYARLREQGRELFRPTQVIRTTKLYHRQVYEYAYHQPKLAFLRGSDEHERFAGLADFLEAVPKHCPHDLFQGSVRASESAPAFLDRSRLGARRKENFATRLAQLVIPSVGDNYRRHETLQRFMLANDSVTLAVEVPIWLTPGDIRALERHHGIKLRDGFAPDSPLQRGVSCEPDFLEDRRLNETSRAVRSGRRLSRKYH